MIPVISVATFTWLTLCAFRSVRSLTRGVHNSIDYITLVAYVFCGWPLLFDLAFGVPVYSRFPGFEVAAADTLTHIIYCSYISFCMAFWWHWGHGTHAAAPSAKGYHLGQSNISTVIGKFWIAFALVLVSPLALLIIAPNPSVYRDYSLSVRLMHEQPIAVETFHTYLCAFCALSVVAGAGLLLWYRRIYVMLMLVMPIMAACIWIIAKRYAVAEVLVLIGYALWYRGVLRGPRLIAAGVISGIGLIIFSTYYQSEVRHIDTYNYSKDFVYEMMRVDYGREDVIKTSIYAELHPDEMQILDHRGESLWIYLTLPIPRSSWPDKPVSYGRSMWCTAVYIPRQNIAWGMTTSILEEAITNFSWFGMLIGPWLIAWICRIGDSCGDGFISAITVINATLLLLVHLSAFAPIMLTWHMLVSWYKLSTRSTVRINRQSLSPPMTTWQPNARNQRRAA